LKIIYVETSLQHTVLQLSHRGPDAGNKEVQLITGSKRTEGGGREGTKNEIRKILRS